MNRGVSSVFEQCTICPQGEQKYCGDARPGAGGRGALLLQEQGALQVHLPPSLISIPSFLSGYVSLMRQDPLLVPLDSSSPWWKTGAYPGTKLYWCLSRYLTIMVPLQVLNCTGASQDAQLYWVTFTVLYYCTG